MDITGISTAPLSAISPSMGATRMTAAVSTLKKAMDIQQQSALLLLQALPDPTAIQGSSTQGSIVGQYIDVRA